MHFNSFPSTTKRNWVSHIMTKVRLEVCFIDFHKKKVVIRVCKGRFRIFSRVKTKQGMKQLKDREVMDPQFLILLFSNIAILVGLKGGHNACIELTIKLGGRGPKFVEVKTPLSNKTSLLVHKIFFFAVELP